MVIINDLKDNYILISINKLIKGWEKKEKMRFKKKNAMI